MKEQHAQILQKFVFVGEPYVGKTSLLAREADNTFNQNFVCTIGVDFKIKVYNVGNVQVKAQFWDTAGQERFRSIQKPYYRGCSAVLICFDLSKRQTFEKLDHWLKQIELHAEQAKVFLLGCKSDLDPQVATDQILVFADSHKLTYYQTSAKINQGVKQCFENIVNETAQIHLQKLVLDNNDKISTRAIIAPQKQKLTGPKKTCC